jgi:hypothetical protein
MTETPDLVEKEVSEMIAKLGDVCSQRDEEGRSCFNRGLDPEQSCIACASAALHEKVFLALANKIEGRPRGDKRALESLRNRRPSQPRYPTDPQRDDP